MCWKDAFLRELPPVVTDHEATAELTQSVDDDDCILALLTLEI